MSGTAQEARAELMEVYDCGVARVPLRNPCLRSVLQPRLFVTVDARWRAVVERVMHMHAKGRPVLVGTGSVAESEELSRRLAACGVPHAVLNARYDAAEAALVAAAGQPGRVTVTTNMAGRGTDIVLGPGVAEAGGLHVILCQHNASRRIDRQLFGRCARRGEPGSCEAMLCLDDLPGFVWAIRLLTLLTGYSRARCALCLAGPVVRLAAWREDLRQRAQRRMLLRTKTREPSAACPTSTPFIHGSEIC